MPTPNQTKNTDPLAAEIARLREENAKLTAERDAAKAARLTAMSMAISSKGALSVYGLGRFPVTLYPAQWERLLGKAGDIQAFISEGRKLGAFGKEDRETAFVQPNGLPLKFVAKAPAAEPKPKTGSAL